MATLFEKLGGMEAIVSAADLFYEKVVADERTSRFFSGIDMELQSTKMVAFMAWAFGGPDEFKGRDLRVAHRDLVTKHGLNDTHFDVVAEHLKATLDELGIAPELTAQVLATVGGTRNEVLDR